MWNSQNKPSEDWLFGQGYGKHFVSFPFLFFYQNYGHGQSKQFLTPFKLVAIKDYWLYVLPDR